MPVTQAPLFKLMSARLAWLGEREVVLGQNLANADTPDYRPRDLRPADFARLAEGSASQAGRLEIARTDLTISGSGRAPGSGSPASRPRASTRPRLTATP